MIFASVGRSQGRELGALMSATASAIPVKSSSSETAAIDDSSPAWAEGRGAMAPSAAAVAVATA